MIPDLIRRQIRQLVFDLPSQILLLLSQQRWIIHGAARSPHETSDARACSPPRNCFHGNIVLCLKLTLWTSLSHFCELLRWPKAMKKKCVCSSSAEQRPFPHAEIDPYFDFLTRLRSPATKIWVRGKATNRKGVPGTALRHAFAAPFQGRCKQLPTPRSTLSSLTHQPLRDATMIPSISSLLALSFCALTVVHAQYPAELVGTWTTKSKKVITGPVCLAQTHSWTSMSLTFVPGLLQSSRRPNHRA